MKQDLIFLDTFAINQLMHDHKDDLVKYLLKKRLRIVFSSLQLVELYNPNPSLDDRINNIIELFLQVPFVIADPRRTMSYEELCYPKMTTILPLQATSYEILNNLSSDNKLKLLSLLFTYGLPDYGVPLEEWVNGYSQLKSCWPIDVEKIIEKANNFLNNKNGFLQFLDLRLCDHFYEIKQLLDTGDDISKYDKKWIAKLNRILQKHDSNIMRGIHLSSLIFWHDYVIAKKKIFDSDIGDIYYSVLLPYCKFAVIDNSRFDCLQKIQKQDNYCIGISFFNKKAFLEELIK